MAKRKKPARKRRARGSTDSSSSIHNSFSSEHIEAENGIFTSEDDSINSAVVQPEGEGELSRSRVGSAIVEEEGEGSIEGLLRLPEMTDTSMNSVGQPLRDVMDQINGSWEHPEVKKEEETNTRAADQSSKPPMQQPFREDSEGKPPDPAPGETFIKSSSSQQTSAVSGDLCSVTPTSPDSAHSSGGHNDSTEQSQSQTLSGSLENGNEADAAGQKSNLKEENTVREDPEQLQEEKLSPSEMSHPAEFK